MNTHLTARRLELSPQPLAIARRLWAAGLGDDLALLHSAEGAGRSWLAFGADAASQRLDPLEDDDRGLVSGPLASTPRWIGVIPYEARRGLEREGWRPPDGRPPPLCVTPEWRRYRVVVRVDPAGGEVVAIGGDRAELAQVARRLEAAPPAAAQPLDCQVSDDEPPQEHLSRVTRVLELITDGDLYQVNLARRLALRLDSGQPLDLYQRLVSAAPCAYGALLRLPGDRVVLSTSPELLLQTHGARLDGSGFPGLGWLTSEPIKGTRPRGIDAPTDAALARELDADAKERAELAMIVDVVRNDLSSVCRVGSVRLVQRPRVVTLRTLHHRKARLVGLCRPEMSRAQVLAALVPSGSVTGAPKVRAMEVIAELERHRRGLYTGGLGYVSHDGNIRLAMAIRTLVLRRGAGHYWTGGGIVADSDPEAELRETGWKALQLLAAATRRG